MQTNLQTESGFVTEVEALVEANELFGPVRLQIEEEEQNRSLKVFYVRAGCRDVAGEIYNFLKCCGREPPDQGRESGAQVAKSLESWLRERLEKLNVKVREGAIVG